MADSLRIVTVPNPAAGVDFVYVHPPGVVSKIRNLRVTYVPDPAVICDRHMVFSTFELGGLLMSTVYFNDPTTDSDTLNCHIILDGRWGPQFVFYRFLQFINQAEAPAMYLLPGWTLQSQVVGWPVTDQISQIYIEFEDLNLVAPGAVA
jgi:hypothetical protein